MGKDTIENAKPIDVEVSIDGEPLNEDVLFIEALNVPMIGPHLRLGETPHDAGPEFDVGWLPARDAELFIEWLGGRAEAKPAPLQRMRAKQLLLTLSDGRRLQALTVVDAYTREALRIEVDQGIKGEQVVFVMGEIAAIRGVPKTIRVDNGPEFVSKALDRWAYENGVTLDSSRPGKPTDNAFVESFNGKFRAECLDAHRFLSLDDARGQDRGLAAGLQRELPSHVPGLADAQRIRLIGRGQTPANEARSLTLRPDKIQEGLIGNSISATLILIT